MSEHDRERHAGRDLDRSDALGAGDEVGAGEAAEGDEETGAGLGGAAAGAAIGSAVAGSPGALVGTAIGEDAGDAAGDKPEEGARDEDADVVTDRDDRDLVR